VGRGGSPPITMGEYVWTTMKIGGAVPRDKVEEFKSIAKNDFPDDIDGDTKDWSMELSLTKPC
jgi:hypothetical protein